MNEDDESILQLLQVLYDNGTDDEPNDFKQVNKWLNIEIYNSIKYCQRQFFIIIDLIIHQQEITIQTKIDLEEYDVQNVLKR